MAQTTQQMTGKDTGNNQQVHEHRTAKIIEIVGSSTSSFQDAVTNALNDASKTTRGIHAAEVTSQTVTCDNGNVTQYKVCLKVAFGVEGTNKP